MHGGGVGGGRGGGRVLLFKPEDYNFTSSRNNDTNKSCAADVKQEPIANARTQNANLHRDHTLPALLSTTFAGFDEGRVEPGLYRFYILQ